jgi:hypothetical protein
VRHPLLCIALVWSVTACGARSMLDVDAPEASAPDAAPDRCGPSNCGGCCDDGGACRAGTETEACGTQGLECQACNPRYDVCNPQGGGDKVTGQFCWAPCDVKSCGGCCTTDGSCMVGTADDACGSPPTICVDCAVQGTTCGLVGTTRGCVGR